jgi:RNA polymerase sigma-70 factor (ECF subfamily)
MRASELEFQQIHDTFRPQVQRYLTRLVGAGEAEDLTQEVFVRVSQALKNFRGEAQLSTWIYRIATNAAIDKMRTPAFRQGARTCSLNDANEGCPDFMVIEEPLLLEQRAMRKERYECFQNFVENLPANYRAVVALSELGDLTNNEIAAVLGVSSDTVKIRLHRGRAMLLEKLKCQCKVEDWL